MRSKVISCHAPYGQGGMARHFAQVVEEARSDGSLERYYSGAPLHGDDRGELIDRRRAEALANMPPIRFLPAAKLRLVSSLFDRAVATRLIAGVDFHGFSFECLHSMRRARTSGAECLALEDATGHVNHVARQLRLAERLYGIERGVLSPGLCRDATCEYALADVIYVTSRYSWQACVDHGIRPERLRMRTLEVHPRFRRQAAPRRHEHFVVVYVGALRVDKGIPVLIEAFTSLPYRDAELRLVGGWTTHGMRTYLQRCMARDRRIRVLPGDPLPHLHDAAVYVHPTFHDGLGLAPLEAMACGVPVIVTEDTGMKERVSEGVDGFIVPTGDWESIHERLLDMASRGFRDGR